MYEEIPGYQSIKPIYLEDDSLTVDGNERYYYEKIKDFRITNYSFFSPYAMMEFTYEGRHKTIPFNSRGKKIIERAQRELRQRRESAERIARERAQKAVAQGTFDAGAASSTSANQSGASGSDAMVRELENLKKLLDEGILTEEEFTEKKRQILGL